MNPIFIILQREDPSRYVIHPVGRALYEGKWKASVSSLINSICSGITMSMTWILPEENTIAFGGVPTGSMKAKDVVTHTGSIKYMGFFPMPSAWKNIEKWASYNATDAMKYQVQSVASTIVWSERRQLFDHLLTMTAMIGIRRVQMAVLLVTFVRKDTIRHSSMTMSQPGRASNTSSCSPIQSARPDSWRRSQGNFIILCWSTLWPRELFLVIDIL